MKNFHPTGNCPIRDVLSRLGDKWSMLVLITLNANGTMRFSDIHKTIEDVSQRMLTVTLRTLESDGLVERKVYAEVPPRVEYCLTDTGGTLIPHIEGLGEGRERSGRRHYLHRQGVCGERSEEHTSELQSPS